LAWTQTFLKDRFFQYEKKFELGNRFVIGFMGRLVKEKGLQNLVEAVTG
jgi:glycosyltransferase involved in cell wall biosynthesis